MKQNIKKLTLQYGYLSLEEKDVSEACASVEKEISEYMEEHFSEDAKFFYDQPSEKNHPIQNEENKTCDQDASNAKDKRPKQKDIKKLYRRLASKIHPDKTNNSKEKSLFAEAAEAYENNDIGKLLEISGLVNLEIPELSEECVSVLNGNILYLSKKIENMKTTSAWAWYRAKNHEEKIDILHKIVNTIRRTK